MEDNFAVEEQQVSLASGAYPVLHFGKAEMILRHMAAVMEAVIDLAPQQPPPPAPD